MERKIFKASYIENSEDKEFAFCLLLKALMHFGVYEIFLERFKKYRGISYFSYKNKRFYSYQDVKRIWFNEEQMFYYKIKHFGFLSMKVSFSWEFTPEGSVFWDKLNDSIKDYMKEHFKFYETFLKQKRK